MKKIIALILVLVLAASLFACGGSGDKKEESPPPTDASQSNPPASQGGSSDPAAPGGDDATSPPTDFTAANYFGFFDPSKDYAAMNLPSYKFAFLSMAWDNMTQRMADNFDAWAGYYGSTCTSTSCDSNVETMISNIELYCAQGYDGLLINCFSDFMDRVIQLCDENDMPWWSVSEIPRSSTGVLDHPYVITDGVAWGDALIKEEVEWMKANIEGFDPAKTMILVASLTTISEFSNRSAGCEQGWKKYIPEARYEVADGLAEGGISAEIGYNMCATRYTANPDIEFWIYASVMDTFSPGMLRFIEEKGMEDRSMLASLGGDDLIPLLDSGTSSAWIFSLYGDICFRWNSCFNALYAVVAGWTTYEEMWPDVQKQPGDNYGGIELGWITLTADTYKDYLAFCDAFTGLNNYPQYGPWSGTAYPVLSWDMPS